MDKIELISLNSVDAKKDRIGDDALTCRMESFFALV